MTSEMEKRMEAACLLAANYSRLEDQDDGKPGQLVIVKSSMAFSPAEMAYFCQQLVSRRPDTRDASAVLTVFTNRLVRMIEETKEE